MSEKRFAVIRDGVVENIIVAKSIEVARVVCGTHVTVVSTEEIDGVSIGFIKNDDGTFSPPPEPTEE